VNVLLLTEKFTENKSSDKRFYVNRNRKMSKN